MALGIDRECAGADPAFPVTEPELVVFVALRLGQVPDFQRGLGVWVIYLDSYLTSGLRREVRRLQGGGGYRVLCEEVGDVQQRQKDEDSEYRSGDGEERYKGRAAPRKPDRDTGFQVRWRGFHEARKIGQLFVDLAQVALLRPARFAVSEMIPDLSLLSRLQRILYVWPQEIQDPAMLTHLPSACL